MSPRITVRTIGRPCSTTARYLGVGQLAARVLPPHEAPPAGVVPGPVGRRGEPHRPLDQIGEGRVEPGLEGLEGYSAICARNSR